ncbi:MAG: TonB-dependent receptor [Bacteroidetes bacterium]|nr:MAG: TonB-dependent receptor [Bacteroidota bacterium]
MKISLSILFFTFFLFPLAHGQSGSVEGKLIISGKGSPLIGAHVSLMNERDTTLVYRAATDTTGYFKITNVNRGTYRFDASFLGYLALQKTITVASQPVNLGTMTMNEQAIRLNEVLIEEQGIRSVQKGDTTEYTAQSFKVNKDANAEELVTKMPGVTVENGTVKAQGENVQQVLVDGRQFFGNDPTLALRNLPAEVIDKIQVFDKMSDQAQFTGFDDGRSAKTMNIVTRPDRRQGQFGKFNAGYGTENRYVTSGNLSNFSNNMRLSVLAMSNNVNQQNFATQDVLGVMSGGFGGRGGMFDRGGRGGGRGGGMMFSGGQMGNFLMGQQSGISYTHSLGINYSDSLATDLYASGSYFFNLTDNQNPQTLDREYMLSGDSSSYYNEVSDAERKNYNHRFNLRTEYEIDTSNTLIVTPQISFQDNNAASIVTGSNTISSGQLLSKTEYQSATTTSGYSSDNRIVYRHRFPTPRRTVSLDFSYGKNRRESDGSLLSHNVYYTDSGAPIDSMLNQRSNSLTNGYSLSSSLSYTEPLWTNSQMQINYSPSYSKNASDKTTYDFDPAASTHSILNSALSNSYENTYTTHNTGISFRYREESFNLSVGTSYQIASLHSDQLFPYAFTLSKTFYSILPNLMLNYELPQHQGLRLFYRTSTNAPSLNQLQSVVDNSNPLFLSTGNPDLKQSFTHTFLTRLSLSNAANVQSILLFVTFNFTRDYIANSTFFAQQDTMLNNISLNRGTQLTMPVNIDGYWSARTFATYGFPIEAIKSNLNVNTGFTYSRTPGLVNNEKNIANVYAVSPGFVLGSNISEKVDFTLNYTANFNTSHNSLRTELDNNYFTHNAGFRFTWTFLEGFVFRNELNNSLYSGLTSSLNQNVWLWNMSIGKKFFENDRGELTFSAVDILNQNKSISRTVTETYIEDTQTQPLQRYFLLTFTYTLREFGGREQERRPGGERWHEH